MAIGADGSPGVGCSPAALRTAAIAGSCAEGGRRGDQMNHFGVRLLDIAWRKRAFVIIALLASLLAWPLAVRAQQPEGKIPRIGILGNIRSPAFEAFERGLRELGYVEGKNIVIEWRLA